MKNPFASLSSERFRQTFLIYYVLSSLVPILVLLFLLFQYIYPHLSAAELDELIGTFTYALVVMLVFPILGILLIAKWIKSLEKFTAEVKIKSAELIEEPVQPEGNNEMIALQMHFEHLYSELQDKMLKLNQYSKQLIEANSKLSEQAIKDELTTIFNRRYFDMRLSHEVSRAERYKHPLSLVMIDIDGFKQYNDTYGHPAGDKLLHGLGLLIRKSARQSDIPCRYGGDEFAVILPETYIQQAGIFAQKLVDEVARRTANSSGGKDGPSVSLSCGVAEYLGDQQALIDDADKCMYMAKTTGKGRVICGLQTA
ncbi:MAG: GGDEF domain-containing protein [Proteobacteria bacterium]|nr:GGDEF domain-containing protein [Pseudomonadota bacterium]